MVTKNFDIWFKKQYGNRPSRRKNFELELKLEKLEAKKLHIEELLVQTEIYDAVRNSTLLAFNALKKGEN